MAKRYKKNWRTQPKVDHYQKITDQILDNIAKTGTVPWQKPWNTPAGAARGIDGKPYRGINSIMTNMQGYSDPRWATFNKIKQLGGMVKQGETTTARKFSRKFPYSKRLQCSTSSKQTFQTYRSCRRQRNKPSWELEKPPRT